VSQSSGAFGEEPFTTAAASGGGSIPLTSLPPQEGRKHKRRTSLAARGEPMVWLTGGSAAVAVLMIIGLFVLVGVYGFSTFWPQPVERVAYTDADGNPRVLVGERFRTALESINEDANANSVLDEGEDIDGDGELDTDLELPQTLWKTGNRELSASNNAFTWLRDSRIDETSRPEDYLLIEREETGEAMGVLEAVAINGRLIEGFDEAWAAMQDVLPGVRDKVERIDDIKEELGKIGERKSSLEPEDDDYQSDLDELNAEQRELEAELATLEQEMTQYRVFLRTISDEVTAVSVTNRTFNVSAASLLPREQAGEVASVRLINVNSDTTRPATAADAGINRSSLQRLVDDGARLVTPTGDTRPMVQFLDASGNEVGEPYALAPRALLLVEDGAEVGRGTRVAVEPLALMMSQVVRAYAANQLSFGDKVGVYLSRWWEFLSAEPRDANTKGGVFKQIVGTVLLTFIMIIFVVPIGVVAAIYLREYARQGALVSFVRICVNNLAGVPSIVYGVFGLGFFCYSVGGWLDGGAAGADVQPLAMSTWALWLVTAFIFILLAIGMTSLAGRFDLGAASDDTLVPRVFRFTAGLAWAASVVVVFYFVIASVPVGIFGGFYPEELAVGQSVWKGQALLWASLTLALLTLPVVIVATEEALAAVPRSMREGSYACGASKWQTIRTIVLPRAMPGIMTGAILAIARGAGEVDPIMLVGALKSVDDLPVGSEAPFLHLDQAFMHLGYHIFDLGFKSPDAEAARSMVYTTTLLLILIVLVLNLSAIWLRSRLRRAFEGGQF
jgi:ABC-type phosphate transport system permease subunit